MAREQITSVIKECCGVYMEAGYCERSDAWSVWCKKCLRWYWLPGWTTPVIPEQRIVKKKKEKVV